MIDRYLITGGAGFIGSHTAENLLRDGMAVTIFDNFSRPGSEFNAEYLESRYGRRLTIVRGDVRDRDSLCSAAKGVGAIIHLAAQVAVTTSVTDPRSDFEINALGTFNVVEAARLSPRPPAVLFGSTNKVYGKMEDVQVADLGGRYAYTEMPSGIAESRPLDFYSPYGCSKGAGDQYVIDYARIYGLKTAVFRQSCIYGPRQFGVEDQGWVAWFAIRALQNEAVTIFGDGKQVRDVLFIDDLVALYRRALERIDDVAGHAFNIGGGPANTLSLLELVRHLERRFGRPLGHSFADWRPGDQLVYISNIAKAQSMLDWTPKYNVTAGLDAMIDWLAENESLLSGRAPEPALARGHYA